MSSSAKTRQAVWVRFLAGLVLTLTAVSLSSCGEDVGLEETGRRQVYLDLKVGLATAAEKVSQAEIDGVQVNGPAEVASAREAVSAKYDLSSRAVQAIEAEGDRLGWPRVRRKSVLEILPFYAVVSLVSVLALALLGGVTRRLKRR